MKFLKQKRPYSIKKFLYRYFLLLFLCTSAVLIFYCVVFMKSYSDQMSSNAAARIDYYSSSLETEMKKCTSFEQKLCYSDSSFQLLTIKNLKDTDKVILHYNVTEMLKRQVAPYECIFIFDKERRVSTYAAGESFSSNGTQYIYQLKDHLRDYWLNENQTSYNKWIVFQDTHHTVLMKALKVRDVYVCTTIDLENFDLLTYNESEDNPVQFGFFNNTEILTNQISVTETGMDLTNLTYPKNPFFSNYYIMTTPIEETDISMFCLVYSDYMGDFAKVSILVFVLAALVTCIIIVYTFYSFHKILLYPLDQINAATKHLEQNDPASFLSDSQSNIIEYQNINNALSNLIEQKITLTNEKQAEAFEKDHARLQYYQMQTRSHFFINCLKSLYNMLESKEYEKMQRMIIAFSNHLRYIFHDNLKLVTLQSELAEVNDYYNIILLDRVSPFILNTQVDETLLPYRVPSLIIQTFLENTAKYNRESGSLLIFDIKIERAELNGKPVMQIMLSDNGTGYDQETLDRLNSSENDLFARKHVGISNLKRRIALIYKTDYQFAFYNKPAGGACGLLYLPLIEAPQF